MASGEREWVYFKNRAGDFELKCQYITSNPQLGRIVSCTVYDVNNPKINLINILIRRGPDADLVTFVLPKHMEKYLDVGELFESCDIHRALENIECYKHVHVTLREASELGKSLGEKFLSVFYNIGEINL